MIGESDRIPDVKKVAEQEPERHEHNDVPGYLYSVAEISCQPFPKGPESFELRDFIYLRTLQHSIPEDSSYIEYKYRGRRDPYRFFEDVILVFQGIFSITIEPVHVSRDILHYN